MEDSKSRVMEDADIMDEEFGAGETIPFMWNSKNTALLLKEFIRLCPQVGVSIKNMTIMYIMIAKTLKTELNSTLTPAQMANKMKSLRRKYVKSKEMGRRCSEFGSTLEKAMKIMDQYGSHKGQPRVSSERQNVVKNTKQSEDETYSVEIVDESFQDQVLKCEVMDLDQFLRKKETSKTPTTSRHQDLFDEEVIVDARSREGESDKFVLLSKKIENQEKALEEKLKKNELIGERNKLIASLLSKKTRNDVVDAIRKDRLIYHTNMKELWAERLQLEKRKLEEKKRKNNLLEERNVLMKALLDQMKNQNGDSHRVISKNTAAKDDDTEDRNVVNEKTDSTEKQGVEVIDAEEFVLG